MAERNTVRCEINCQHRGLKTMEFEINSGVCSGDGLRVEVTENPVDGCRLARLRLEIQREDCWDPVGLTMEKPIRVFLPMQERPEMITAMYMYNNWWTRPAFAARYQDIPDRTQVMYLKYRDRYACFLPMVGDRFKTWVNGGTDAEICLEMTAYLGGQRVVDEPLYVMAEAETLEKAVHTVFAWLAEHKGISLRAQRRVPEMFRYLGWCSWDAFYTDVTEEKIRQKAAELREKQVPVNWMIIDDGWFTAREQMLADYLPDSVKFPHGFRPMIEDIKASTGIRWFGVWHALGGYWDGIAPVSALAEREKPYLYKTVNGRIVPDPETGSRFYSDWYEVLKSQLIDFVKVDGQSAVPLYFENCLPVSQAARGMNRSLERGAARMDGAVINCMGMAMENVLARPVSAISRNSDDFFPNREGGFAEHLLQNAYNAIYHNEIYCCDWDMFWTQHPDCEKHSLLRAISGGPVYFSDRIGCTDPQIVKPLVYADGEILMMDRSAKPTEDCVFSNPMEGGVLKLHNVASWGMDKKAGGIAVYNLTNQWQSYTFKPADIPDLEAADSYWVYDFFGKRAFRLGREESYWGHAAPEGYAWFVMLPVVKNCACLGLMEKFAGFTAVESICQTETMDVFVIHESGTIGWISEKPPRQVIANGADVTAAVSREDNLYTLWLPEAQRKIVVSIAW